MTSSTPTRHDVAFRGFGTENVEDATSGSVSRRQWRGVSEQARLILAIFLGPLASIVSEISNPQTQTMDPMNHKWQCAMCEKPKIFGSIKDAVTYVHGKAVCADHSRELLRLERGK